MMKNITYVPEDKTYVFECPHCDGMVQVKEKQVQCQIFRHGATKANNKQINPHATQEECERLVEGDLIYGCGKPFRIFKAEGSLTWTHADKCDYI